MDADLRPPRPQLEYPFGSGHETSGPAPRTMMEVAPGVFWVKMPLPWALKAINLWLLEDGDGWTLVDTGVGLEDTREHWRELFALPMGGKPIHRVICTHMHPDHVGLAGWICRKFSAPLWMSRLEYVTCRMLVADTGREAPQDGVSFLRACGWDEPALDSYRARFGEFGRVVSRLPDSYHRLKEGDVLDIGGARWEVLIGNGHSPEHVCLFRASDRVLISGDQVLPRISSNVSVFPTEPLGDPLGDWLDSCAKLRAAYPADTLVLPAHNEPFRGLHERLDDLIGGHHRSLERLLSRLDEPKRTIDVFGALYARTIGPEVFGMATGEAMAHLNYLLHRGRITRQTRDKVWYWQQA